jgi:hypothetical protein
VESSPGAWGSNVGGRKIDTEFRHLEGQPAFQEGNMAAARRLYLYVLAGVGLGLVLVGGITMLRLLLQAAGVPGGTPPAYEIPDPNADKAALSQALAYVAVGLPVWLIHWGFVERLAGRHDAAGSNERGSIPRALFFLIVLSVLLASTALSLVTAMRQWLAGPLGTQDPNDAFGYGSVSVAANLASAVLLGSAWFYHLAVRDRDIRLGPPLREGAARSFRLSLYGAALIAMGVSIQAFLDLETTIGNVVVGHQPAPSFYGYYPTLRPAATSQWWVWPVLSGAVTLAVAIPIWLGHLRYSDALLGPRRMGAEEAASRMRLGYFVAAVGIAVGTIVGAGANGLTALFAIGLRAPDPNGYPAWQPLAIAVLTGAAMLALLVWYRGRAIRERVGGAAGAPVPARVLAYGVALLGLSALAGGSFAAVKNGASALLGPAYILPPGQYTLVEASDPRVWEVAVGLGYATIGLVVWAWSWRTCAQSFGRDRPVEALALSRRLYLLVVAGGALIAVALGAATVIERAARTVVGLRSVMWDDAFSGGVAALAVAIPLLAAHAPLLRRDFVAMRSGVAPEPEAAEPEAATVPAPTLVIAGPAGADMERIQSALSDWLPPGFSVELRDR